MAIIFQAGDLRIRYRSSTGQEKCKHASRPVCRMKADGWVIPRWSNRPRRCGSCASDLTSGIVCANNRRSKIRYNRPFPMPCLGRGWPVARLKTLFA